MVNGRVITAGIMFAIFVSMVGFSFTYPAEARFMPLVIGLPGIVLTLIQLVSEIRSTKVEKIVTADEHKAEIAMFLWFLGFIGSIILFGFPIAGPVMVALYLHFSWNEKWWVSLSAAVFAWVVLHYVFGVVLGLPLFEGLVVGEFMY